MIAVRPAAPSDRGEIDALQRAAFGRQGAVVCALLADLLPQDGCVSLVAERDGAVVGHVATSRVLIDAEPRLVPAAVLSPLGVLPTVQGSGIGTALVRAALADADARGMPFVLLEGDPRYYSRFGFRPGASLGLRRPSLRIPEAGFQAVPLAAHEPWMTGTMVYPDVWWRHDLVGLRHTPLDRDD